MAHFIINVLGGVKRLFCNKKYLALLIIVILLTLYTVHKSTDEYKDRIADIKEFQKLLASQTSTEVNVINPFEKFSIDENRLDTAYLNKMAPQAAICMGLAVRRVNDK